jgi:RimJ/RimL family protein N-acetyltransferase
VPTLGLRAPEPGDDPFLAHLRRPDVAGPYNWFEDRPDGRVPAPGLGVQRLVVALPDGAAIGALSWLPVPYGPNLRSRAWKIGITLAREQRGRGYGARAQHLLAAHLFATTEANRVEADTDVENVAERRALERAGFVLEGILRGAQYRGGRWRDLAMYSRLRGDPPVEL